MSEGEREGEGGRERDAYDQRNAYHQTRECSVPQLAKGAVRRFQAGGRQHGQAAAMQLEVVMAAGVAGAVDARGYLYSSEVIAQRCIKER